MESTRRIADALYVLRIGVFVVMLMWTLDKFVNPAHAATVFARFYGLDAIGMPAMWALGGVELLVLVAFLAGYKKGFSYGLVLVWHAASTFSAWRQYLDPFDNLLFFAAFPMLAACWVLYRLRDLDTRFTLGG